MHNREITHIVKTQLIVANKCSFWFHLKETCVKKTQKKLHNVYENTMQ